MPVQQKGLKGLGSSCCDSIDRFKTQKTSIVYELQFLPLQLLQVRAYNHLDQTKMKNSQLLKVANTAILCLQKYTNKESIERQAEAQGVTQALKAIRLQDLGIIKEKLDLRGIGYRNILEKKGLRITIYFLPAGETIKLHNHPAMLVVSYVVQGRLEAKLYSPTGSPGLYNKETSTLEGDSLSYIDGLRNNHKNLHQFRALEDTYFIDILFPDYDDKRECTFFEEEEAVNELTFKLRPSDPGEITFFQI